MKHFVFILLLFLVRTQEIWGGESDWGAPLTVPEPISILLPSVSFTKEIKVYSYKKNSQIPLEAKKFIENAIGYDAKNISTDSRKVVQLKIESSRGYIEARNPNRRLFTVETAGLGVPDWHELELHAKKIVKVFGYELSDFESDLDFHPLPSFPKWIYESEASRVVFATHPEKSIIAARGLWLRRSIDGIPVKGKIKYSGIRIRYTAQNLMEFVKVSMPPLGAVIKKVKFPANAEILQAFREGRIRPLSDDIDASIPIRSIEVNSMHPFYWDSDTLSSDLEALEPGVWMEAQLNFLDGGSKTVVLALPIN